jgi:hypothetical protein
MTRYILMLVHKPAEVADCLDFKGHPDQPSGWLPVFDGYEQAKAWSEGQHEITMMEG